MQYILCFLQFFKDFFKWSLWNDSFRTVFLQENMVGSYLYREAVTEVVAPVIALLWSNHVNSLQGTVTEVGSSLKQGSGSVRAPVPARVWVQQVIPLCMTVIQSRIPSGSSLISTHEMTVAVLLQIWQSRMSPDFAKWLQGVWGDTENHPQLRSPGLHRKHPPLSVEDSDIGSKMF